MAMKAMKAMSASGRGCVACGKSGHTVTTCTSRAAALIRDLKAKLKLKRVGQRRKPKKRVTPQNTGKAFEKARRSYTPNPVCMKVKLVRRVKKSELAGRGLISLFKDDGAKGLEDLEKHGYVARLEKCPACKVGKLSDNIPRLQKTRRPKTSKHVKQTRGAKDSSLKAHFIRKCTSYSCRHEFNVLKYSRFRGSKLTPMQIALVTKQYTNTDKAVPPASDDLAADCEGGRKAVGKVVNTLRSLEVAVAKSQNKRGQLAGDLEIDGHSVRSFHVSPRNQKYTKYITKKLLDGKHKYYLCYARVLGLRKRGGGRTYLAFAPPKLLPPGSRPPPESEMEVMQSGLLKRAKKGSCVIHSDGVKSVPAVIKKHFPGLKHHSVSHKIMQFTKRVRSVRLNRGQSASQTGTQCIDSTWKGLDKMIPPALHTKNNHELNPKLEEYVWSWLYRCNHTNKDGFATLGGYARTMV
jgi:hypothetical protein